MGCGANDLAEGIFRPRPLTPHGTLPLLASGTPILGKERTFERGIIIFRPLKEIHKLVNRISGARATFHFEDIITGSPEMLRLIERLKSSPSSMSNILIIGESGTGKELIAQAVHNVSPRRRGPFIAVNCGAIPRELIGSELFGYAEGAFTGAKKGGNPGKFELANGGTIFLDEIGDLPFDQQATLLRVVQERSITRIGGREIIPVDVRIICATNKDLSLEMNRGRFRHDLYYRLNVISVKIPPLRERTNDVLLLFKYFLKKAELQTNKKVKKFDHDVEKYLILYDWPGNVRELQNVVECMVNNMYDSNLEFEHLPTEIRNYSPELTSSTLLRQTDGISSVTMREARALGRRLATTTEKNQINELLIKHGGNITRIAREIGVARSTIYKKMK